MRLIITLLLVFAASHSFGTTFYENLALDGNDFYRDRELEGVTIHVGDQTMNSESREVTNSKSANEGVKSSDSLSDQNMRRGLNSQKARDSKP